ncbi:MAG TPA: exodeoxyribonuclease VII large subunit [Bacillales bacterium]|nr:exodeoxyribonuclease VII large subunit [Bacillales bacterium]
MTEQDRYISVTALTRYVKRLFEKDRKLRDVWVRGELSNFKHHSRGHMYFTLKDQNSRIQSVMFAGQNRSLKFRPESGMKVLVRGDVSVYEPYGQYQFYAKEMQPDGIGNLYLAFEELKKKLQLEGVFSDEHKKPLPAIPSEIAVVTSPTGAAVRDIFTTIKRRFPAARITLFPVLVQGTAAAASIAKAIDRANKMGAFDVMIIGRGGGSIEELWAFNEEIVARRIFASVIPVISAVGHETDYTIADFVSDMRAPTPTGAGELAVPHFEELGARIDDRKARIRRAMIERVAAQKERAKRLQNAYAFRYPAQLVRQNEQELDRLLERLIRETKRLIQAKKENWRQASKGLTRYHPEETIKSEEEKRAQLANRLRREMEKTYKEKTLSFKQTISKMDALSPLNVMKRGFSLAYGEDQTLIKSVQQVHAGDLMKVRFQDGRVNCQVWGIEGSEINGRNGKPQ